MKTRKRAASQQKPSQQRSSNRDNKLAPHINVTRFFLAKKQGDGVIPSKNQLPDQSGNCCHPKDNKSLECHVPTPEIRRWSEATRVIYCTERDIEETQR